MEMEESDESRRFKQMIVTIGRLVKEDELETLKYLCKEIIPTKNREKIATIEALVEKLEERHKVSPTDLVFLKQILQNGLHGRADILAVVAEFEQPALEVDAGRQDFSRQIIYLASNLGREYKSFLRRLEVRDAYIERKEQENPRNVGEVIHQCLLLWVKEHSQLEHSQLVKIVVQALRREKRNDLANNLESETFD